MEGGEREGERGRKRKTIGGGEDERKKEEEGTRLQRVRSLYENVSRRIFIPRLSPPLDSILTHAVSLRIYVTISRS